MDGRRSPGMTRARCPSPFLPHVGLGLGEPRVAILAAVEVINPKIPGTADAASLCKMAAQSPIHR